MAAPYLKNRTPHKALKMETPFKMLHSEEVDLSHICVIGARTSVHIKDSRNLDAAAWEGKVCGCSEEKNLTESGTQRLIASWREGTSPSSRHRDANPVLLVAHVCTAVLLGSMRRTLCSKFS